MDEIKLNLTRNKYMLPYHWIRDLLHKDSLPYFGYIQIVLNELPPPPAAVLDAGCGDGRIAAEMFRHGYTVTGVDYLDILVSYAKALVPEGTFFVADLRKSLVANNRFNKGQFSAVVMVEVYEHIPPKDCPAVLNNMYEVLRPGGILIISVPSKLLTPSKLHYRHFELNEFEHELEAADFKILNIIFQHRMDWLTSWLLSNKVERFLNNQWLQPVLLKRIRRSLYMRYGNTSDDERHCGRFVVIAER